MARRFFVTLESVAPGDVVTSMSVGERLYLPRRGRIECGRVQTVEIVCRGEGQGGRKCFGLSVDGERVVIHHYGHHFAIWVRGAGTHEKAELMAGDSFGPCEGIRFVLGVEENASVLHDLRRMGRWWCARNPRGDEERHQVWSAVDLADVDRTVRDIVLVHPEGPASASVATGSAFRNVLHPSWPVCIERFRLGDMEARVGERTAGVSLSRIVKETKAVGASVDGTMAAWLVESIGRALVLSGCTFSRFSSCASVRFDDGQPVVQPAALRMDDDDDHAPTRQVASLLRDFDYAPANDRVARALAAAEDATVDRATLVELLDALADARDESGSEMRAAWHGLVQRLFPDEAAADRDVVEALRLLSDDSG